jgi:hypothetical protein
MKYRILQIEFSSGVTNFFPQKLTWTGYQTIGDLGLPKDTYKDAQDVIKKYKAQKIKKTYFW